MGGSGGRGGAGRGAGAGRPGRGGADQEVGGLSPPPFCKLCPPPLALWSPRPLRLGLSGSGLPAFTRHPTPAEALS